MWSQLFTKQPTDVFDVANDTMSSLNKLRDQRIVNALNQIKLNYAPQMARQAADKGAADVSIEQTKAKYQPQLSQADISRLQAGAFAERMRGQGEYLDNITKKAEAEGAPAKVLADLNYKKAQTQEALAHAHAFLGKAAAPAKGAPIYIDPKTGQTIPGLTEQQATGAAPAAAPPPTAPVPFPTSSAPPPAAPVQAPPDNAPIPLNPVGNMGNAPAAPIPNAPPPNIAAPRAPVQPNAPVAAPTTAPDDESEQTFPGANPNAMNVLGPVGVPDSRGHPVALQNLRTGERFAVMTPQGREKSRVQLIALRQAIPYMDDLVKYGTVGAIGPSGKNQLLPNSVGGVPRAVAAQYEATLNKAVEHVIAGSALKQTETTLPMIHAVLNRLNWESAKDYTNRIHEFKHHLENLEKDTSDALGNGYMSIDRYAAKDEEKYLTDAYNKVMSKDKNGSDTQKVIPEGMIIMTDVKTGKQGYVPKEDVPEALSSKQYRLGR